MAVTRRAPRTPSVRVRNFSSISALLLVTCSGNQGGNRRVFRQCSDQSIRAQKTHAGLLNRRTPCPSARHPNTFLLYTRRRSGRANSELRQTQRSWPQAATWIFEQAAAGFLRTRPKRKPLPVSYLTRQHFGASDMRDRGHFRGGLGFSPPKPHHTAAKKLRKLCSLSKDTATLNRFSQPRAHTC